MFSCFALPYSFCAVPRVSDPVFIFCAPELFFSDTEGVGSSFHFFCFRTCFRWYRRCRVSFSLFRRYRRCRVPFSCFALPDLFGSVQRSSGPVFIFCDPGLAFDGTEGAGPRFHVLRSRNRLGLYQGRRVVSHFHVLSSQTRFLRYRGRRVPFSCFALLDSFLAEQRASSPVFMFCAPVPILGGTEGVGSSFHALRCQIRLGRYRARQVLFLCFVLSELFSAISRAKGPVFVFCALTFIFDGTEDAGYRLHVLRSRTHFRRTDGIRSCFQVLCSQTLFWRYQWHRVSVSFFFYRGCQVLFSCFALPNFFWAVSRARGPVFMICAIEIVWGCTKGGGSHF
jgi:hypothetical protein